VLSPKADLVLKFEVVPDIVYANFMPPMRRPQPYKIGMILTVTNAGNADFNGSSPNTGIVRFSVLRGRTTIWESPEMVGNVVLPVVIKASAAQTYTASWEMPDAVDFVGADLHAVAIFTPTGDSAMSPIQVKQVF